MLHYFFAIPGYAGLRRGSIILLERLIRGGMRHSAVPGWALFAVDDMMRFIDDVKSGELELDASAQRFECNTRGAENNGQLLPGG